MSDKTLVCRCEDLTLSEVEEAMDDGYLGFEDLKRSIGIATGPCQGKACVAACIQLIADRRGIDPSEVDVMTFRPPARPVSLATLAQEDA